jgi:predicted RNA-binding protein YlxR (DUF448 family)
VLAHVQPAESDAGPRKTAPGDDRLCAATGTSRPVADMIRFVIGPDGAVVPDLKRRLPGRGVWVTATRQALGQAIARKAFARSFKRELRVAPDLLATTERLLEREALNALAMAHKAGRIALGFGKTEAALGQSPVVGLVHAADGAADGVRKLAGARRRKGEGNTDNIVVITTFTAAQLDLALGRSNVIHAALLAGPESQTFLARAGRLERFRAGQTAPGKADTNSNREARESEL